MILEGNAKSYEPVRLARNKKVWKGIRIEMGN